MIYKKRLIRILITMMKSYKLQTDIKDGKRLDSLSNASYFITDLQ